METELKPTTYVIKISVVMPGQTRPSTYTLGVKAFSRGEALAKAEEEFRSTVEKFNIAIEVATNGEI
jgi:hypothetical protein